MLSDTRSVFKNQQRYNSSNNQQKCNRKKYSSTALKTVRSLRKKRFLKCVKPLWRKLQNNIGGNIQRHELMKRYNTFMDWKTIR